MSLDMVATDEVGGETHSTSVQMAWKHDVDPKMSLRSILLEYIYALPCEEEE
jgi:hypothetical protein